jgi:hypothetical protein
MGPMSRRTQLGALALCAAGLAGVLAWVVAARESAPSHAPKGGTPDAAPTAPKLLPSTAAPDAAGAETPGVERPVTPLEGAAAKRAAREPPDATLSATTFVVVDGRCEPVPGARVELWILDRSRRDAEPSKVLTTEADGTCATLLPQEPFWLKAGKDGVGTSGGVAGMPGNAKPLGRDRAGFVIELRPQGHVTFVGLESGGQPAAAAELKLYLEGAEDYGVVPAIPTLPSLDAQGRCEVDLDDLGLYQAWLERPGKKTPESKFRLVPGGRLEVPLQFPGDWWVQGAVVGPRGEPIPNTTVSVWQDVPLMADGEPMPLDVSRTMYSAKSGATGRFRIDVARLLPGTLLASRAGPPAFFSLGVEVTAEQARSHEDVIVKMLDAESISGTVRTSDGRPGHGLLTAQPTGPGAPRDASRKIRLIDRYSPGSLGSSARDEDGSSGPGEDGSFTLYPVTAGGVYELQFIDEDSDEVARLPGVPAGARGVELVVPAGSGHGKAGIRGTIVDGATGAPVPWFSMACWKREGSGKWQRTGRCAHLVEGERNGFEVSGLDAGTDYLVRVGAEGYGRTRVLVRAAAGEPAGDGDGGHDSMTVSLWKTSTLEVTVLDADGRPVPWVPVLVSLEGDFPEIDRALALSSARADADGVARFADLDAGPVAVTVTRGEQKLVKRFEIAPGSQHAETVALDREPPR